MSQIGFLAYHCFNGLNPKRSTPSCLRSAGHTSGQRGQAEGMLRGDEKTWGDGRDKGSQESPFAGSPVDYKIRINLTDER